MRILLLVVWMLIPVGALAFHLGPGLNHMKLDEASQMLAAADAQAAKAAQADATQQPEPAAWKEANKTYGEALSTLPSVDVETQQRVRLERAKAQMHDEGLPEAHDDLIKLVDELENSTDSVDAELLADARGTLANSQYYITWLKRLEGKTDEAWLGHINSSQSNYRLLAKEASNAGDLDSFVTYVEDLESSVRLARMDLGELQGLPLPNQ